MGMPSRAKVLDFWREWLEESDIDLLEPQCWCCFRPFRKSPSFKRLAKMDNPSWREIRSAWNEYTALPRCHIVSTKLGGMDEPENIFLMCKRCHGSAPDTRSKEVFLRWVSSQYDANRLIEIWGEFKKTLQDFDVDSDEELLELVKPVGSKEFKVWARRNIVNHFGPYGPTLKMSTLIAALLEFRNQHNRQDTTRNTQEQLRLPFDDS